MHSRRRHAESLKTVIFFADCSLRHTLCSQVLYSLGISGVIGFSPIEDEPMIPTSEVMVESLVFLNKELL